MNVLFLIIFVENMEFLFENIIVKYDVDVVDLFYEVSFMVKGFEKVGIIGVMGVGKFILIDVLSGFLILIFGGFCWNGESGVLFVLSDW